MPFQLVALAVIEPRDATTPCCIESHHTPFTGYTANDPSQPSDLEHVDNKCPDSVTITLW